MSENSLVNGTILACISFILWTYNFFWLSLITSVMFALNSVTYILRARTASALRQKIESFSPSTDCGSQWSYGKRYLILVNPNSGNGKAHIIYTRIVKPMLSRAKINFDTVLTERQRHAFDICKDIGHDFHKYNSFKYDVIVSVSGDGMLHEIINGLCSGFEENDDSEQQFANVRELLKKISVGIIPAGSSNGVAHSIGNGDPFEATKTLISGRPKEIDIFTVVSPKYKRPVYDLHFFCWALFADHDYLLEHSLRCLGPAIKSLLAPIICLIQNKTFEAEAELQIVDMPLAQRQKEGYSDPCELPLLKNGMRLLKGKFCGLACGNLKDGAADAQPTPFVKQSEGAVDLLITKPDGKTGSRWNTLMMMLNVHNGKHIFLPHVDTYKITKMNFRPISASHMQCSGEEILNTNISLQVHKGLASIMCPNI